MPLALATLATLASTARAATAGDEGADAGPSRPTLAMNRWQEDWSALADPANRTAPFDSLKYIPLSSTDPRSYLSLGVTFRERFEWLDASGLGAAGVDGDSYLIQRTQAHADLHFDRNVRAFVQLEDDRAFAKTTRSPVDQDRLDLRVAFLEYVGSIADGQVKARVGRQDFAFDLQRFVSVRDGPNVRQSFDAAWADWEHGDYRLQGFVSEPVQYQDGKPFDDHSNGRFRFHLLRFDGHVLEKSDLSAYYALWSRQGSRLTDASGDERRHVFDVRFDGGSGGWNWDAEAMLQTGRIGAKTLRAWAAGPRIGYQFTQAAWRPHLELQADIASGDRHLGDSTEGTFNPLFPNGYYFTQGGFTGYANLVHLKTSLTLQPAAGLMVLGGLGLQWRQTIHDAVYVQPNTPIQGTAGRGSSWSGAYAELRAEYAVDRNIKLAAEADRFHVSDGLAAAGARDSSFASFEFKYLW